MATSGPATLGSLAVRFGCELKGDPDRQVDSVATLQGATSRSVSFLANLKYRRQLATTAAGAVILDAKFAKECPVDALISPNPYATFARIAAFLHPVPAAVPGVHPSAVVDETAHVAPSASIAPGAVIEGDARIGERAVIGPNCVIMQGAQIGDDSRLVASVTVCRGVRIGARSLLHPGAVVGADGFGFAREPEGWLKVPQIGSVTIGDDVEIGASTTIDRGAIEDTVIASGVKLDNQIQIGHNVRIGEHTVMAGCCAIAGSVVIGRRCIIGGMVGIAGHLTIGDGVQITGLTMVSRSLPGPGVYSSGWPAQDARQWRRTVASTHRLARKEPDTKESKTADDEGDDD
jgi:UDP-3-O-[3-hydroxymyristoyl] glucosamine N-acyltransferase